MMKTLKIIPEVQVLLVLLIRPIRSDQDSLPALLLFLDTGSSTIWKVPIHRKKRKRNLPTKPDYESLRLITGLPMPDDAFCPVKMEMLRVNPVLPKEAPTVLFVCRYGL